LPLEKDGNVPFAKSPLFAFFKGGQNIFASKFIDRVRAHVKNDRNLFAIEQLLFSFQHKHSPEQNPVVVGKKFILSNKFSLGCQGEMGKIHAGVLEKRPWSGLAQSFDPFAVGIGVGS
jgi:hypothetical protein